MISVTIAAPTVTGEWMKLQNRSLSTSRATTPRGAASPLLRWGLVLSLDRHACFQSSTTAEPPVSHAAAKVRWGMTDLLRRW